MRIQEWILVFAATDSSAVNARVYRDAVRRRILCCRCDDAESSHFTGGAVANVGAVTLAVSTAGASPGLSVRIRDQAAAGVDPVLVRLAELMRSWRTSVRKSVADPLLRRRLLEQLSGPLMEETLRRHGPRQTRSLFARLLREAETGGGGHDRKGKHD